MKILVLGAGRVGNAIIRDLAADGFEVTAADAAEASLARSTASPRWSTAVSHRVAAT